MTDKPYDPMVDPPTNREELAMAQKAMSEEFPAPKPDMTLFKFISKDAHEQAEKMAIVSDKAANLLNTLIDKLIRDVEDNPDAPVNLMLVEKLSKLNDSMTKNALALVTKNRGGRGAGGGRRRERSVEPESMSAADAAKLLEKSMAKKEGDGDGAKEE